MEPEHVTFGPFRLDRRKRILRRDGIATELGQRACDVLCTLVAAKGAEVSKDMLMAGAWPGQIVEENTLQAQISLLRKALGEAGQRCIITVPGRGYRLVIDDAAAEEIAAAEEAATSAVIGGPKQRGQLLKPTERPALALPDKPSIAVLPFQNLSGDPEQEYFADGVVEDIITSLSRSGWLFVIARNSSFAYKGISPDIRKVGRELGVRYVLEGSVRRAGGRVRITAQLIDATTGGHVWAERFEDSNTDLFALQDRIREHVVGALESGLQKAEIARATTKPTESLDAYDVYLRALQQVHLFTESSNRTARLLLRQAIAVDSRFGLAKAQAAECVTYAVIRGWIAWGGTEAVEGVALARSAVANSPDDPTALQLATFPIAYLGHDLDAAHAAASRALVLNNNSAGVLSKSGWICNFLGDFATARDHFSRAIRLSPLDPFLPSFQGGLAMALSFGEPAQLEPALNLVDKILQGAPSNYSALQLRTEVLVMAGRITEAKEAARTLMSFYPQTSISAWRLRWPHRLAVVERMVQLYRAAGIAE